jgi:hypothetical protein
MCRCADVQRASGLLGRFSFVLCQGELNKTCTWGVRVDVRTCSAEKFDTNERTVVVVVMIAVALAVVVMCDDRPAVRFVCKGI